MSPTTASKAKHAGGRPRVKVTREDVQRLRDSHMSWRQIARALGIGSATAMRLHNAAGGPEKAAHTSVAPTAR